MLTESSMALARLVVQHQWQVVRMKMRAITMPQRLQMTVHVQALQKGIVIVMAIPSTPAEIAEGRALTRMAMGYVTMLIYARTLLLAILTQIRQSLVFHVQVKMCKSLSKWM